MTTQKDFKRVVRARMQKTGESYTAARANLLKQHARASARTAGASASGSRRDAVPEPVVTTPAVAAPNDPAAFAKVAGKSDAIMKERTGCTWEKWVAALDHLKAHEWSHREIARYVHERYKVPGWWAQTVTVGYERIRGLRETGQRRGGSWEVSKSRTIPVPVSSVYRAFKDARRRRGWLGDTEVVIRTAVENKSIRMTWDDGTSVEVYLVSKGRARTQVTIQHVRLPSAEARERRREYWAERLAALVAVLLPAAS